MKTPLQSTILALASTVLMLPADARGAEKEGTKEAKTAMSYRKRQILEMPTHSMSWLPPITTEKAFRGIA